MKCHYEGFVCVKVEDDRAYFRDLAGNHDVLIHVVMKEETKKFHPGDIYNIHNLAFAQVFQLAESVGFEETLTEDEALALWDAVTVMGPRKHLVEIGCHLGRSSTLLMFLAKKHKHMVTFIDPWGGPPYDDRCETELTATRWFMHMRTFEIPFTLHCCKTEDLDQHQSPRRIDFLYIDGDHSEAKVEIDCQMIGQVVPLGTVAFHDYGRYSGIKNVVDRLVKQNRLKLLYSMGTMMITRKIS